MILASQASLEVIEIMELNYLARLRAFITRQSKKSTIFDARTNLKQKGKKLDNP